MESHQREVHLVHSVSSSEEIPVLKIYFELLRKIIETFSLDHWSHNCNNLDQQNEHDEFLNSTILHRHCREDVLNDIESMECISVYWQKEDLIIFLFDSLDRHETKWPEYNKDERVVFLWRSFHLFHYEGSTTITRNTRKLCRVICIGDDFSLRRTNRWFTLRNIRMN